jgi:hypothetical protein
MAWDATRPVPWKRLLTFFAAYAGIAAFLLTVLRGFDPSILSGLVLGGSVYLLIAVVLVKFGWNPPSFRSKNQRAEAAAAAEARAAAKAPAPTPDGPRPRPKPTSRTTPGPTNHPRRTRATRRR